MISPEWMIYGTATVLALSALWALIELARSNLARRLLWLVIPLTLAAVLMVTFSVSAIKGKPTSTLPSEEWVLISHVKRGDTIFMWIIPKGKSEPLSIQLVYHDKQEADEAMKAGKDGKRGRGPRGAAEQLERDGSALDNATQQARQSGRMVIGRFKDGKFGFRTDEDDKARARPGYGGDTDAPGSFDLWLFDVRSTMPPKHP